METVEEKMTEEAMLKTQTETLAQPSDSAATDQQHANVALAPHEACAYVSGEPLMRLPDDLFIPPEALQVFLDAFEGPLDLLLYLIKRHNIDILDIPIAEITRQYMSYIDLMQELKIELAAQYLAMAACLAEIKSRMLLPRTKAEEEEDIDPRADLVRRLQLYEQFKQAAEDFDALPRYERDVFPAQANPPDIKAERPLPEVDLKELLLAFKDVLERAEKNASHQITREVLSIRERMTIVLDILNRQKFATFTSLFAINEGRMGVVVSFIAILELMKQAMIEIVQAEPYGPIHVKVVS